MWALGFVGYKSCVGCVLGNATLSYYLTYGGTEGKGIGSLCGMGLISGMSKVWAC